MTDFTVDEIRAGNAELLKLADALDVADAAHIAAGEPTYDQSYYTHECNTPACALGHARVMHGYDPECAVRRRPDGEWESFDEDAVFAMDYKVWVELFGPHGCGCAKTAKDAASYIRSFVSRREARLGGE